MTILMSLLGCIRARPRVRLLAESLEGPLFTKVRAPAGKPGRKGGRSVYAPTSALLEV